MCLTCGCMDAHLEMGEANITYEDVKRAADENGRSVAETLDILERTKAKDRQEHPQEYASPAEARSWLPGLDGCQREGRSAATTAREAERYPSTRWVDRGVDR